MRPDDPSAGSTSGRPIRRHGPEGEIAVFVADEQDAHPVDTTRWTRLAEQVLVAEGIQGEVELSVIYVDETHIADLNQSFMGHSGPTDVLSFPIDGVADGGPDLVTAGLSPAGGGVPFDPDDVPLLLGDVFICPAVAARQAADHAGSYDDELALLLVHGVLHILGFDHAVDTERVAMQARERELLEQFHGPLAADPWADQPAGTG